MHTLEIKIFNKVRCEVEIVMSSAETRVQDVVLAAIESSVITRVELRMKSVNASSGRGVDSVVLDPDRKDFQKVSKAYK